MPKIPIFKERQRLQAANPTGFQSTSAARRPAEALGQLAGGLVKYGSHLEDLKAKQDAASKTLAERDAGQAIARRLQETADEIKKRGGSGDKDVEDYDTFSQGVRSDVLFELDTKYGGKYGENFSVILDEHIAGTRAKIYAGTYDKKDKALKKGVIQFSTQENGNVRANPGELDNSVVKMLATTPKLIEDMGGTEAQITEAKQTGARLLAEAAVRGLIDKGDSQSIMEAENIILNRYTKAFEPDQQKAMMKEIKTAQYQAMRLETVEETRLRKQQKEKHAEERRLLFAKSTANIAKAKKAGNGKLVSKLENKFITDTKRGKLTGPQLNTLLNESTKGYKKISAASSYNFSQKIYRAFDPKGLDKLRNNLEKMVVDNKMTPERAEYWEKQIVAQEKAFKTNPKYKTDYKVYAEKLKAFSGEKGLLAKVGLSNAETLKKLHLSTSEYMKISAETLNPKQAYEEVLRSHFSGEIASYAGQYKGYHKNISTKEELKSFSTWGRARIDGNSKEFREKFLPYYKRAKAFVELQETIRVNTDPTHSLNIHDQAAKEKTNEAIRSSIDILEDIDELTKPRKNEQPLIEQQELYIFRK